MKKRPLGIPTFTDKLVQEAVRMILEAIYEPVFTENSRGFRTKRSCHTALKEIKNRFNGVKWFIEGDIKGCFDNIDHHLLIEFINLKINELDKKVEQLCIEFNRPATIKQNPEYRKQLRKIENIRKKINRPCNAHRRQELLEELQCERTVLLNMPAKTQNDKQLKYIRYADDFIIGVNGSRKDCEWIKAELKKFIGESLKMKLSEEKTLITHSTDKARFLGYDISIRRTSELKSVNRQGTVHTKRTLETVRKLKKPKIKIKKEV